MTRLRPSGPVRFGLLALLAALTSLVVLTLREPVPAAPVPSVSAAVGGSVRPSQPGGPATAAACDPLTGAGSFADDVAAQRARAGAIASIQAFDGWLEAWRQSGSGSQEALVARGVAAAEARRVGLKHLIRTDPRRALESAVPVGLRAELPAEVQDKLEVRLDGRGEIEVGIACIGAESRTLRTVTLAGQRYEAFVYGRRDRQATKQGLPLHGIAVDEVAAFADTPYRPLDGAEKAARGLEPDTLAVLVGTRLIVASDSAELAVLEQRLVDAESRPGPFVASLGDSGDPLERLPGAAAVTSPVSWIIGEKRVLWLKLEFSDDPGEPVSDATLATTASELNTFYQATSGGKTSLTFATVPALLRLPRSKAYYGSASTTTGDLRNDARAAAQAYDAANGGTGAYDPDKFDRWIMVFKRVPSYNFAGLGNLGGPTVWLNNAFGAGVAGHELGHNQSLDHAHSWLPSGTSPIGPGTHVEYGDVFDRMGSSGSSASNFFNVAQKHKLGYLDATGITDVSVGGTYRLMRHDHRDAAGVRALRIGASNVEYEYWIEHRRLGPTALTTAQLDRLQNGVLLHWGSQKLPRFVSGPGSYLLDMTPGSAGGTNDAPLRIGEAFTDPDAGITIRPVATGGTAPDEYIDVQVSFGAVDGNRNPVLLADAPAGTLNARTNITVSAAATDPDGDPVYYRWDFSDGKFQPSLGTVTTRFLKGGTYPVTVSAHDGRGGIAVKTYSLKVNDPLTVWTKRSSPLTNNALYDVTYAAGRFVAVGDNGAIVSSVDGTNWTRSTALSTAHFYRGIAHNGTRFATAGVGAANASVAATGASSADGLTWTAATFPAGVGTIYGVAAGGGRFVAVGAAGRIYTSADGTTWTETASPVATLLRAVTYANGLFVAAGDSGRVVTSVDGLTWANRSVADSNSFAGVAYHNGSWYLATGAVVYSSPDAVAWTRISTKSVVNLYTNRAISTSGVLLGTYGEGRVQYSEDGQTWTGVQLDATTGAALRGVAEGAGVLVAVGNSAAIYSASLPASFSPPLVAPSMRLEGASLKLSVGRPNVIAAGGPGYSRLELYANGTKVSEFSGASGFFTWTPAAVGNYALTIRGVDASGASAMSASYPAQAGLANWNWRAPGPVGSDLTGAVRVDGKWWIVGNTGNVLTLDAAGRPAPVDFATTQNLTGIGYGNGRFVITAPYTDGGSREPVGDPWVSSDGFAWTALNTASKDQVNLNGVDYLGRQWIAPGNGTVLTSADGLSWSAQVVPVTTSLLASAYGAGLHVVVGQGGKIITSPDGVTWTERTSGVATDLRRVTCANGTFVAAGLGGVILSSPDGITWTRRTSGVTTNLYAAAFIKGGFVVAGDAGTVLASPDGATWTPAAVENRGSHFLFAAGADNEGVLLGRAGELFAATTATSFRRVTRGTSDARNAVIHAGGRFIAVGEAADALAKGAALAPISVSADGATWTRATLNGAAGTLNDVTYGQSRYVAVGNASAVFTSTDGLAWTQRTLGTTGATLSCVTAGPGLFVAASTGQTIYSSPDGATWSQRATGQGMAFRGLAYGDGRYVAVGDGGGIRISTDGLTWSAAASGTTSQLLNVAWFEGVGFLAAGAAGTMLNSTDGLTWRVVETGIADTIYSIARTPVGFLAPAGTVGTMLMSLDGINWTIGTIPADRAVRGVAASATTVVAVGDGGTILSYDLADPTPAPTIAVQPVGRVLAAGSAATFSVTAENASGGAYQWLKDGVPIVGANSPTYTTTASSRTFGSYTVMVMTPTGAATSSAAILAPPTPDNPGRLVNLSLLTAVESATDSFRVGTVVGGAGTAGSKPVLIRAAGPSLVPLGVTGTLSDPNVEFYRGTVQLGANDNWGGVSSLSAAFTAVGAFPYLSPGSRDAAIYNPAIAPGDYSIRVTGNGGTTGNVIAELYDATPAAAFTGTTPRLVNVSVLKEVGAGFTVGFTIGGGSPRTVLVRAVGPGLAAVGVPSGYVPDPRIVLYAGSTRIVANDDWGGGGVLATAMTQVGAFSLPSGSKDAALLATLAPGGYSVQVSAPAGTTGLVIAEVYEVP